MIAEQFSPGDLLPSERELSSLLGVGRSSLREALRILSSKGLISAQAGRGTFVSASARTRGATPWHGAAAAGIADLIQVRLAVEPMTTALAAARKMSARQKRSLLAPMLEQLAADSTSLEHRVVADIDFHRSVASIAGNVLLERVSLLDDVSSVLTDNRRVSLMADGRRQHVLDQHTAIADAVTAGDSRAAAFAMIRHVASFACDIGLADTRFVLLGDTVSNPTATEMTMLGLESEPGPAGQ